MPAAKRCLSFTVKGLNRHLSQALIKFHIRQNGRAVRWEHLERHCSSAVLGPVIIATTIPGGPFLPEKQGVVKKSFRKRCSAQKS
jgi:hypothetical protein